MSRLGQPPEPTCSFCHKPRSAVSKLIAANNASICSDCVALCVDLIKDRDAEQPAAWLKGTLPPPSRIKEELDRYIVGQDRTKRRISVAVYNHYKRLEANERTKTDDIEIQKSNVLLLGPTGTGKTLIAQTLARFLDVPFVIADATTLTEAGYVGEDVENMIHNLYQASGHNPERTMRGIVYIDEIDKITRKGSDLTNGRDVSGEGVQQALLKLIEGTVANIHPKGKSGGAGQDAVQIDTSHILFLCGGAFEGLTRVIARRLGRRSMGFGRENTQPAAHNADDRNLLKQATAADLAQFGLIPEFIGRLPVITTMDSLETEDLVRILTEPRNALVKQYQRLFKLEGIELVFTQEACEAIAAQAFERNSGARGLRAVMEKLMLPLMFDAPSMPDLQKITLTGDSVRNHTAPGMSFTPQAGTPS